MVDLGLVGSRIEYDDPTPFRCEGCSRMAPIVVQLMTAEGCLDLCLRCDKRQAFRSAITAHLSQAIAKRRAAEPLHDWQVKALPEGAEVTVIWSGGNGPHEYVVSVDRFGHRYVWDGKNERMRFYNLLTFVGRERFHTRVWLGHGITTEADRG